MGSETFNLLWINSLNRQFKETPESRKQDWFKGIFYDSIIPQNLKRKVLEENTNHSKKRKF